MSKRSPRTPVTVISGFLGSGKTTLMNQLLKNPGDRKIAVVVNDLGEINIDASLLKTDVAEIGQDTVIELTNGCICCSIQDDLSNALLDIIAKGDIDHILIESTGVAEPSAIIPTFMDDRPYTNPLGRKAQLNALITVVDAPSFYEHWKNSTTPERTLGREQPLFDLMLEQVEYADILIINKTDLVNKEDSEKLKGILHEINQHARILVTTQGAVDTESILSSQLFQLEKTMGAPRWISEIEKSIEKKHLHKKEHTHHHDHSCGCKDHNHHEEGCAHHHDNDDFQSKYGLGTFLYTSRRPFNYEKLSAFLKNYPDSIVRAKGFCWVKKWNDEVGLLSIAGKSSSVEFMGEWWAAKLERGEVNELQLPEIVRKAWKAPHGDRRQELVFIGVNLDEAAIRQELDNCLK